MIKKIPPYEKLVDYVKRNPQKGLTIPHTDIEQIIGIPYRKGCNCLNNRYSNQVRKANDKLTLLSLRLEPIKGFGYRILNDNQYIDSMKKAYNTGIKNIQKAMIIADNTDFVNFTIDELEEWTDVRSKIKSVYDSTSIISTP